VRAHFSSFQSDGRVNILVMKPKTSPIIAPSSEFSVSFEPKPTSATVLRITYARASESEHSRLDFSLI